MVARPGYRHRTKPRRIWRNGVLFNRHTSLFEISVEYVSDVRRAPWRRPGSAPYPARIWRPADRPQ
jgi:hypothetical protein